MAPRFHRGIPIWKQGLTHPHMEMGYPCFHMGNQMKGLPVSIWGSPQGNRDWHVPVSIQGQVQSLTCSKKELMPIWGLRKKSPDENDFRMGIDVSTWWFPYGNRQADSEIPIWGLPVPKQSLFPFGDNLICNQDPRVIQVKTSKDHDDVRSYQGAEYAPD
jgi:hypothetical protein